MKDTLADSTLITADAGYHSEANLKRLDEMEVDALVADNNMRSRDERFAGQDKYKALPDPHVTRLSLFSSYPTRIQ